MRFNLVPHFAWASCAHRSATATKFRIWVKLQVPPNPQSPACGFVQPVKVAAEVPELV